MKGTTPLALEIPELSFAKYREEKESYYRGAMGVLPYLLVYDVTDEASFNNRIRRRSSSSTPFIVAIRYWSKQS